LVGDGGDADGLFGAHEFGEDEMDELVGFESEEDELSEM